MFVAEAGGTLVSTCMHSVTPSLTHGVRPFIGAENVMMLEVAL